MLSRVLVSLLVCFGLLCGQQVEQSSETIRVDVDVVNVPVTVTDSDGKYIIDLNKDDFEVYEDGQRVDIRYFTASTAEEAKPPLWVGFLVELSNTARIYYKSYKESIGDLAYILIPEEGRNKGFLMGYHTEVDLLVKTTGDPYPIAQRMEKLKHGGGSAMLDAIYAACTEQLASATYQGSGEPRKVIVIVGDGHDNASKRTLEEVIFEAQRNHVTIFGVSTVAWGFHEEEEKNLYKLVRATGGRVGSPMEGVHSDISGILSKPQDAGNYVRTVGTGEYARAQLEALYQAILAIAGDVQSQYILAYNPPAPFSDQKFREIKVKVTLEAETKIRHRTGYYPPEL